jgi:hypothetical protein
MPQGLFGKRGEEKFRQLIDNQNADEEAVVSRIYDAAAFGTYTNAFRDLQDDLFRVMKGMKPAEQTRFYVALQPLIKKTREDVAKLAKRFKAKSGEKRGKSGKKRKK